MARCSKGVKKRSLYGISRIRILPGQYYDSETGLHYNWHRYYDPSTGRYLTPDPIGLDGGVNLYLYAMNNPILLIDPYGLCTQKGFWDYTIAVIKGGAEGFTMAAKVVLVTKAFVAVKTYALYTATASTTTTASTVATKKVIKKVFDDFFDGKQTKIITNKSGDKIMMTKDKKIRFDFKNSHGDEPHVHFEKMKNSKWKDAFDQHRFYPKK
jgi:RHS repeat-associated protein